MFMQDDDDEGCDDRLDDVNDDIALVVVVKASVREKKATPVAMIKVEVFMLVYLLLRFFLAGRVVGCGVLKKVGTGNGHGFFLSFVV